MTDKRKTEKAPVKAGDDAAGVVPLGMANDEKFMEIVAGQRAMFERLAESVKIGAELSEMDRSVIVAALELASKNLPDAPPRSRGTAHLARFPHGDATLEYFAMIRNPNLQMKKSAAIAALAEKYGVNVESIKGAIKKHGPAAERLFDSFKG